MQELPIKRFYRHVLDSKPSFTDQGDLRSLQATFDRLPREALLNLALDVPPAWVVAPKESIHDLDNIKLSALKEGANVDAIYGLEPYFDRRTFEGCYRRTSAARCPASPRHSQGPRIHRYHHHGQSWVLSNLKQTPVIGTSSFSQDEVPRSSTLTLLVSLDIVRSLAMRAPRSLSYPFRVRLCTHGCQENLVWRPKTSSKKLALVSSRQAVQLQTTSTEPAAGHLPCSPTWA